MEKSKHELECRFGLRFNLIAGLYNRGLSLAIAFFNGISEKGDRKGNLAPIHLCVELEIATI